MQYQSIPCVMDQGFAPIDLYYKGTPARALPGLYQGAVRTR